MGKSKRQKSEILRRAAELRRAYRKWLAVFIVVLVVVILALLAYMYFSTAGILIDTGIMPWITAVIAAGALGVLSNKFSKLHREYDGVLYRYKLNDEDVKAYIAEQEGGK